MNILLGLFVYYWCGDFDVFGFEGVECLGDFYFVVCVEVVMGELFFFV